MFRNRRAIWLTAFAVTVVLALSQAADAQPGEGRGRGGPRGPGGFGGPNVRSGAGFGAGAAVRLASIDEVRKALKLSDEQKEKVDEIKDEFRSGFRTLLQEGGAREGVQKLNQDAAVKLAELLDDAQEKRLRGITIQILGANAVMVDSDLAKELNITDEQKTRLQEIQRSNMREMRDAFRASDVRDENRRAKFEKLRASAEKKLLDVLTSEQREQLNALKGEEVKIDMMKLRGGGSGMRNRGGGGERGPGARGRGGESSNDDEKSDAN